MVSLNLIRSLTNNDMSKPLEKQSPLISIILPTYNGAKFLSQQIESIYAQSYKHFEIIASDDASSDNTLELLQQYAKYHNNFYVYSNSSNLGFNKNFSVACQHAKGEFIAPCDQDDIWQADKLLTLVEKLKDNTLVYSNSELIDEKNHKLGMSLADSLKINFISGNNHSAFYYGNCVAAHTMLFKRNLLEYIFPFPETVFFDHWIAYTAARLGTIQYIDKKLVLYRKHAASVTVSTATTRERPKNLIHHLQEKTLRQVQRNKDKLEKLKRFAELNNTLGRPDHELDSLIEQYKKFEDYFFNFEIFTRLKAKQNKYFAITRKSRILCSLEEACGRHFYRFLPIT